MKLVDIHTHRRCGDGIEVLALRAGQQKADSPIGRPSWHEFYSTIQPPFSVGLHPWDAETVDLSRAVLEIEDNAQRMMAIGEIGLDWACTVDRTAQRLAFEVQLELARAHSLPVVVHCVRAFDDVWAMLKATGTEIAIFHGFIGSPQQARQITDQGWYLSFGTRTFESTRTIETLRVAPVERIFLETDDSDMPLNELYARIGQYFPIALDEFVGQIYANYRRITLR